MSKTPLASLFVKLLNGLKKTLVLLLKIPVLIYRYMISPLLPPACRHLPTCSDYTQQALEMNGSWKGGWLAVSRLLRCNPWGSHGFDPVPDLTDVHYPLWQSWKYGRWTGKHIK